MYVFVNIFVVILWFILRKYKPSVGKMLFIGIVTMVLVTFSTIRHLGVGVDTYQYYMYYNQIGHMSWHEIFGDIKDLLSGNGFAISDPGYSLLEKLCNEIFPNFYFFTCFVSLLFMSAIGKLIYDNVKTVSGCLISYLFYISIFYHNLPNNLYRQTIAMAIILWAFIIYQRKKKLVLTVILSVFAITIHKSSIIALSWFVIPFLPTKLVYYSAIILCPTLFVVGNAFTDFLVLLADKESYLRYLSSERTERPMGYIIEILFFYVGGLYVLLANLNKKTISKKLIPKNLNIIQKLKFLKTLNKIEKKGSNKKIINLSFACMGLATSTVSLIWINVDLIRITYYFLLWALIFLPEVAQDIKIIDLKRTFIVCTIILTIGRSLINPPAGYAFYWEKYDLSERYL